MVIGQEDKHVAKREKILAESMENSCQPGWGYFGLTSSLAIGDNSYCPIIKRRPKEEEEAAEPMRQIMAHATKKGNTPDAYFSFETGVSVGDPYQDPGYTVKKGKVMHLNPEAAFMPPGKVTQPVNRLGYEYKDHMDSAKDPKEVREKYRDYTPARQILTNPCKKGGGGTLTQGVLFGFGEERGFPEHMPDDYEAPRKLRMKELEEHKKKIQELPFKGCDFGYKNFQPDSEMFSSEKGSQVPVKIQQKLHSKPYPHEQPFKPANPPKRGCPSKPIRDNEPRDYLGGIYEYVGDPEKKTERKPKPEGEDKAPFRGNVPKSFYNPMPSVVTKTTNMRRERPASFARPNLG